MWIDRARKFAGEFGIHLEHPLFYSRLQAWLDRDIEAQLEELHPLERIVVRALDPLSRRLGRSEIQEGCSARNIYLARELAGQLVTDEGRVIMERVQLAISLLEKHLYCLGPRREFDTVRRRHVLEALRCLRDRPELEKALNGISKPFSNPRADQYIRETLNLPASVQVNDGDATRAVLSAWLAYLRQNVGSCFATAPASIVQSEQPELFLKDMGNLLATGQLTRRVRGLDYSVPLSESWGAGELRRPVVVTQEIDACPSKLWLSPGFQEAFVAAGLIDRDLAVKQQVTVVKTILQKAIRGLNARDTIFETSPDRLMRQALLAQFGVTEEDLIDYHHRPMMMAQGGVAPVTGTDGGPKGALCEAFEEAFERASSAFKSVTDNALLKAWEFTVASFAETRAQLTTWNLYSSLGVRPEEAGGIGARMYEIIKKRLDRANAEMQEQQELYEQVHAQVKQLEARLRSSRDEKQARWLKSEYQSRRNEAYTYLELRDKASHRAQLLANLYDFLINKYLEKIPEYFQEVYDADLHDVQAGPYDDSPAGFRLLYKHGRRSTSQWTMIHGVDEFVNSLAAFFAATEHEISGDPYLERLQSEFAYITTSLVTHVKTETFIQTAFERMARAHNAPLVKDPLANLDKVSKKPWVYTSGGTMSTLVQCYFGGEQPPTDDEIWVEGPQELAAYFIDTVRKVPKDVIEPYLEDSRRSLLVHSPTHAFLLKPGMPLYRQAIKMPTYSYTWMKENFILDSQRYLEGLWIETDMMRVLIRHLAKDLPKNLLSAYRQAFSDLPVHLTARQFRDLVMERLKGLQSGWGAVVDSAPVDSLLYRCLPFTHSHSLDTLIPDILRGLPDIGPSTVDEAVQVVRDLGNPQKAGPLAAFQLRHICMSLLMMVRHGHTSPVDYRKLLVERLRELKLALPAPFIFADSNWVTDYFAFLVNPGTSKLELWRVDDLGTTGAPMVHWGRWLDGTRRSPTWGVYLKPQEYRAY